MTRLHTEVRRGAYHDSIVLMQLQTALAGLPGVEDAGVVMGTRANLELLEASGLLPETETPLGGDDLVIVVRTSDEASGAAALHEIDALLARRTAATSSEFRPRTLESALKLQPDAGWVLLSVPGRYAAAVARDALTRDRNVFLYSDNVSVADEIELKEIARERGLLVMGPDCGTAIVGGYGLGFANRVRRGSIGLVGASGTGLQAIVSAIDELGGGVSHALGTGGRDLSRDVGGATARQSLALLAEDDATEVIVIVSKPPAAEVAKPLLAAAIATGKPVVVAFIGFVPPGRRRGPLHFASGLEDAARLAVGLTRRDPTDEASASPEPTARAEGDLRALFAGGTLCYEAQQALGWALSLRSNAPILDTEAIDDVGTSRGHTILDLGSDEFTVGRPHPMIDQELRIRRMHQEARDPATGVLLIDVVLGDGAHPDPSAELAAAVSEIRRVRELPILAMVVGSESDPQERASQTERLADAGAEVFTSVDRALDRTLELLAPPPPEPPRLGIDHLTPVAAVNAGLEIFSAALADQELPVVQVDWRPPAGGDEGLAALLAKMS